MTLFEAVKQAVTTRRAAEHYGFPANRSGKISCPFHNDRTPSMKVDKRFHCFGCGADGDVIDFVARLCSLDAKAAAEKLAADFAIPYDTKKPMPHPINAVTKGQIRRNQEEKCFRVLSDYLHLLRHWKEAYAPTSEDNTWHPLFVEALQEKDRIENLLDELLSGSAEERAALIDEYGKDVIKLEQRLSEFSKGSERIAERNGGKSDLPNDRGSPGTFGANRKRASKEHHAECVSGISI